MKKDAETAFFSFFYQKRCRNGIFSYYFMKKDAETASFRIIL